MSIVRSILVSCLISLIGAVILFFIGSLAGYEQFKGGYAVLSFDSELNDMELRRKLDMGRAFFGGVPISESSSWVLLDNFSYLEQVPLMQYNERVLPFDPRYDVYAEKLREFFVRDGKRYIFVPLIPGNWKDSFLDRQFTNLMQGISFSVEYFGMGKPLSLYFIVYGISAFALFVFCIIKKNIHLRTVNILTLIPLFSSLSFFGAEGIAAASVLYGLFFLLREPLYEIASMKGIFSVFNRNRDQKNEILKKIDKEIYQPYKTYWKSTILFFLALGLLVFFTPLKLLFLLLIFIASLAVFFASSKIISSDENSRRRFTPVMILRKTKPEFAFFVYMLPFAIGSIFSLLLTPLFPGTQNTGGQRLAVISEEDYIEHVIFQANFSTTKLGTVNSEFHEYSQGDDGLPVISRKNDRKNINLSDYPGFPLKHLIDFLNNVNN